MSSHKETARRIAGSILLAANWRQDEIEGKIAEALAAAEERGRQAERAACAHAARYHALQAQERAAAREAAGLPRLAETARAEAVAALVIAEAIEAGGEFADQALSGRGE